MKRVNKNQMKAVLTGAVILLSTAIQTKAAGTSAAQFLKMGAGARATAMGDAVVSHTNDVTAAYWNPAGLAEIETMEAAVMQNAGLVDTQYQYLGGAMPLRNDSVLAASLYRLDFGSIDRYTASDTKDGSFTAGDLAGAISYGMKINENLMLGASAKFISETLESESASTFAADLGARYKMGRYNLGGVIQNMGPGLKMVKTTSPLPLTVRMGASTTFLEERLTAGLDLSKPNDSNVNVNLGTEYKLNPTLALRGGYKLVPDLNSALGGLAGISAGLGIQVNRFNLDYSISPFDDLGTSHRISLRISFETKKPDYQSKKYSSYRVYR